MTKEEMEREIVEQRQLGNTLAQVLLVLLHRLATVDERVAERIVSDLNLIHPVQEGAGQELLEELLQALSRLGHEVPTEAGRQIQ